MQWYLLVLASLAVWRLTYFLGAEDGPWNIMAKLRALLGNGVWGEMLDCFNCLSLWLSIPFALALGGGWAQMVLLWLALSAAAILLERLTTQQPGASFIEDVEPPQE